MATSYTMNSLAKNSVASITQPLWESLPMAFVFVASGDLFGRLLIGVK